jgi:hypothetical protein
MTDAPVFIVGVQRSGTTLLSAMLAAHSRLSCGPETHFFRRLAEADVDALCDPAAWPAPAAEFVWSITHTGVEPGTRKALLEKYRLAKESVPEYLAREAPSVPAMLRSVTAQYMRAKGKSRWVEKTPDHILHARAIRRHFPDALVVHLVRDPRDVALSLMNVPWGVASLVEGLLYWERLEAAGRAVLDSDPLTLTVRFEDLVAAPADTLQRLCAFIGEEFEPGMLDTSRTGTEINARNAPWKKKVSEGVDPTRGAAWRGTLSRRDNQLAEALLGDRLQALGYETVETFDRAAEIRPSLAAATAHADALGALAAAGLRFWKSGPTDVTRATVYLGNPGTAGWSSTSAEVLADVARAASSRHELYWAPDGDGVGWAGYAAFLMKTCLGPYRLDSSAPAVAAR